jgi:RNA polymerase sigma-70 factor (ECF subfamily)
MNPAPSTSPFAPTRWTLVLRARGATPEARAALSELCEAYYQPVFGFLRREGRDAEAARELAQEFFARLLQRGEVGNADPARGKFRSYLLGALKHFLADQRDYERRQKRGGDTPPESLDAPLPGHDTAPGLQVPDPAAAFSDPLFDRQWALTVMDRALGALASEFQAAGRADHFTHLKSWLVGDASGLDQSQAAAQLGLSESAVKVAIHRLRKRFREAVQAELAQTVPASADLDEELRYLVEVLSKAA